MARTDLRLLFRKKEFSLSLGDGELESFHDHQHVLPEFSLFGERVLVLKEEKGGVLADAHGDSGELVPRATEGVDGLAGLQNRLRGAAEGDDDLGLDDFDFGKEEGEVERDLLGASATAVGGLSGEGRSVFAEIGEVNLGSGEAHRD